MAKINVSEFSQLTAKAIEYIADDEFPRHLQAIVSSLIPISNLFILEFKADHNPEEIYAWMPETKLSKYYQHNYFKFAYQLDPYFQLSQKRFTETFYPIRKIAPDRFFTCEYYKSYYKKAEMGDELGLLVDSINKSILHLSLGRLNREPKFSKLEINKLNQHTPLLCALLKKYAEYKNNSMNNTVAKVKPMQQRIKDWCKSELSCKLTDRESEIAVLLLQGHSSFSAGLTLNIATETVKVHRKNLYKKLQIGSQAEFFAKISGLGNLSQLM